MNKVPFVITTCWLFGSVYSASLNGVDFTATARVWKTGTGEISQDSQVIKPQQQQFHFGRNNLFSNGDENEDSFNPAIFDAIKPQRPSEINEYTQEINQFSDTLVPIKYDYGPDTPDSDNYPTEALDYETTTIDPLNRVAAPPPAVLASLLGSG